MPQYLYGLNIQGIQSLIFETTKLKEIVGASDYIEQVCRNGFRETIGEETFNNDQLIQGAAGRIRYIFHDRAVCERIVLRYAQQIRRMLPGVEVMQAVVKIEDQLNEEHLKELDKRLLIQRNKGRQQPGLGLMISERSRRTGAPAVEIGQEDELLDLKQNNKRTLADKKKDTLFRKLLGDKEYSVDKYPLEIQDMLKGRGKENEWIAVVHADGNSLGKLIRQMMRKLESEDKQGALKTFSGNLDKATRRAAAAAFEQVVHPVAQAEDGPLPIRPVLLGGDDITIIIRGSLALDFTAVFLERFTAYTKREFSEIISRYPAVSKDLEDGLTACAGIAYIKFNYPFHYAVDLAESLCKHAKNVSKDSYKKMRKSQVPASLAFHRVQSSFVEDYKEIRKKELSAGINGHSVCLDYGPYFLEEQTGYATVRQLQKWVREMKRKDAPKSNIRNWLTTLSRDHAEAQLQMNRIKHLNRKYVSKLELENAIRNRNGEQVTHLFDAAVLAALK